MPAPTDAVAAPSFASAALPALAPGGMLGLYPATDFRVTDGRCRDCAAIRQALWYFENETIAVPNPGLSVSGFARGLRAIDDVRGWDAALAPDAPLDYPPLIWIAAPHAAAHARLALDARTIDLPGHGAVPFSLVPKIALNRSWFDDSSARFFSARRIKVRGTLLNDGFVARTLWPEDFALASTAAPSELPADMSRTLALRALLRAAPRGGAESPFDARILWQRDASAATAPIAPDRAVIGIMVNGAQGDDDEAHAGHFALVIGRTQADGAIGDWLVNNFYSLDVESEKGILPAPVPLDNYLGDLNSGQGYYRPSYMLVAVLARERAAALLQGALNRVYNQFYRHQLVYQHATMNCGSISIDVLRALGWNVPARGPTSRALAAVAFPWFLAHEGTLAKAKTAYDYLVEDQTRLLPAAAFEECGASLFALVRDTPAANHDAANPASLASMLTSDVETIAFVRFPQFPSSRAFGNAPAVSTWEYRSLVPSDPAEAQIIPLPPRPFPQTLRDPDLLAPPRRPSDRAAMVWLLIALAAIGGLAVALARL